MRLPSDAIRGIRWAAAGLVVALAVVVLFRMGDAAPAEGAAIDSAPGLVVGESAELSSPDLASADSERFMSPPQVPPPPPLRGDVPPPPPLRVQRVVAPPPPRKPARTLQEPRVFNANPELGPVVVAPLPDRGEVVEVAANSTARPGTPGYPIIIRPPEPEREDNPALRMLKTVGRALGIGRRHEEARPEEARQAPVPAPGL